MVGLHPASLTLILFGMRPNDSSGICSAFILHLIVPFAYTFQRVNKIPTEKKTTRLPLSSNIWFTMPISLIVFLIRNTMKTSDGSFSSIQKFESPKMVLYLRFCSNSYLHDLQCYTCQIFITNQRDSPQSNENTFATHLFPLHFCSHFVTLDSWLSWWNPCSNPSNLSPHCNWVHR